MVSVIVEVTVQIEVIAPSAPAGAQAVITTMNKALAAGNNPLFVRGKWKVVACEKP